MHKILFFCIQFKFICKSTPSKPYMKRVTYYVICWWMMSSLAFTLQVFFLLEHCPPNTKWGKTYLKLFIFYFPSSIVHPTLPKVNNSIKIILRKANKQNKPLHWWHEFLLHLLRDNSGKYSCHVNVGHDALPAEYL